MKPDDTSIKLCVKDMKMTSIFLLFASDKTEVLNLH